MEDENLYDEFGNYIGPDILDNVIYLYSFYFFHYCFKF